MFDTTMDGRHTPSKNRVKHRSKHNVTALDDAGVMTGHALAQTGPCRRNNVQKRRNGREEEHQYSRYTEEIEQLPLGPDTLQRMQHLHDGQQYDRPPRLLPDIASVKILSHQEVQLDVKHIQHQLAAFEARAGLQLYVKRPAVGDKQVRRLCLVNESDNDCDATTTAARLPTARDHPRSDVMAPEELVETLPAARRAVRITQRELQAMRIEREDLERAFVRHRCTLLWQVGEMKRMQKQQDRVTRALSCEVVNTAKSLESSRRRTSALQDIMTELDVRGNDVLRLTREKSRLKAMLKARNIELPEIDEVCVGDRVQHDSFGTGRVLELRLAARQLVVKLDSGGTAYIQEEGAEVLPSDLTYTETEEELKRRLFEKIGAFDQPSSKLRVPDRVVGPTLDDSENEGSDDSNDESSSSEEESGASPGDDEFTDDASRRKGRKRRLVMFSAPVRSSKKSKSRRVIDFPACTIPSTPFETGLLLSPLSELPGHVAAVGPCALQWLPSCLPKNMDEWEQERLLSLQMKGEIKRLRYQLQKAEAHKLDAQQLASDQLESINQLVSQLDKLRDIPGGPGTLGSSSGSHKAPKGFDDEGKDTSNRREDSVLKQGLAETKKNSKSIEADDHGSSVHSDARRTLKKRHSNATKVVAENGNDSSGVAKVKMKAKAQPVKRSLRPRRKAATASPKPK
ncbi:unnamed protein product [Hyaloperonospora brassicae]|uniref:Uncharacterized protein n=1 Tax=Hyaloperonospora brassicae TaxID=162125 RepID=A0AAV0TSV6_HYABA|nr:unnamed protein product [Hyaloperonospora brassicae]CAI5726905.1 unnamed protein product [Hyaloperonospora brassicae]